MISTFFFLIQGDKNVTQTLKEELKRTDWHLMVLHYLGLDHIGHVEGSHSDNIFKKLLEMDDAIKHITNENAVNFHSFFFFFIYYHFFFLQIYFLLKNFKHQLLLVTGDHGMRNGGSHGGSDREELYVPLMGFKQKCSKQKRYVLTQHILNNI